MRYVLDTGDIGSLRQSNGYKRCRISSEFALLRAMMEVNTPEYVLGSFLSGAHYYCQEATGDSRQ